MDDLVEIGITGNTIKWYKSKGYAIPTYEVQLWANINGKKIKNGKATRVKKGTKILVRMEDLPPSSNVKVTIVCTSCNNTFTTTFGAYKKKKESTRCNDCSKKRIKGDGSHSYWVKELITDNDKACCNISGETDKRFLVLHHLDSVSLGGKNTESNYVVLSANYHMAFHMSCGGTNVPCTKEDYMDFKQKELILQSDILAEDWEVINE